MFSNKAREEIGKLFINMALASFVFAILQPFLKDKGFSLPDFIFGFILWLSFLIIGFVILNSIKEEKKNGI